MLRLYSILRMMELDHVRLIQEQMRKVREARLLAQGQMGSAQSGKRPPASASVGSGASKRQRQVQTAPMESSDELVAAAPRLAAAMRSAVKCVKVADKVSSMLEGGLVKLSNASAVFDVLSVAAEEPARWRTPSMRASFRRLFSAADGRLSLFALPQQQSIKLWRLRVVAQVDLLSSHPEHFSNAFLELKRLLHRLPCDDPANEPRSSAQPGFSHLLTGARRDYLPERTRHAWGNAIVECLGVAIGRFEGSQLWARPEVNTLVRLAAERLLSFPRAQQQVLCLRHGLPPLLSAPRHATSCHPFSLRSCRSRRCSQRGRTSAWRTPQPELWTMPGISNRPRADERLVG